MSTFTARETDKIKKEINHAVNLNRTATSPYRVSVLGATGSIGTSTLDLIGRDPTSFEVVALTANTNVEALAQLAKRHKAQHAVIADNSKYQDLKNALSGTSTKVSSGAKAVIDAACIPAHCVIAAIVGAAGLKSAFASLSQGNRLGLANKECLVCAGDVFIKQAKSKGTQILPVDSEHSAAFQALSGAHPETIEKITLTASGGPFRNWSQEKISKATLSQALNHPNWSMGPKVTIDSASMMNKGLELIEAYHLFPVTADQLDTVIHPQSIIHCLVSYTDGSVLAQLSDPDMRTPIALALSWPSRMKTPTKRLDLASIGELTFERPDETRFPALTIAREVLRNGGSAPNVMNAANEVAVCAFIDGQIGFCQISSTVQTVLDIAHAKGLLRNSSTLEDVLEIDTQARAIAKTYIRSLC